MSLFTGRDGKVLVDDVAVADVTSWTFRAAARGVSYASSATGEAQRRIAGTKHGQGKFAFKLNTAAPISDQLREGDAVTLELHLDASRSFSVPAVIDVVEWNVDVAGGGYVSGTAEFVTDGVWTEPAF